MNGEYYLVDKTATGTARVWKHKDYESVIRVVGTPIQYWAICPTATSTNFDVFIPGMELKNSPYDESTLDSLTWNYRGSGASSVSVVASMDSNSGSGGDGSDSETSNTYPSYRTINTPGTEFVAGTYVYSSELSTPGSNSVWVNENDLFVIKVVPAERSTEMGGGYSVNIYIGPKQSLASLSYSYCTYYGSSYTDNIEDAFSGKQLPVAVFTSGNIL